MLMEKVMNTIVDDFADFGLQIEDEDEIADDSPEVKSQFIIEDADVLTNPYLGSNGLGIAIPTETITEATQLLSADVDKSDEQIEPVKRGRKKLENALPITIQKEATELFVPTKRNLTEFISELETQNEQGPKPVKLPTISVLTESLRRGMKRVVGDLIRQRPFVDYRNQGLIYKSGNSWVIDSDQLTILQEVFEYFAADKTASPVSQRSHALAQERIVKQSNSESGEISPIQIIPPKDLSENYIDDVELVEPIEFPDESFTSGVSPVDLSEEINSDPLGSIIIGD
jgi:hypothetical protein